MQSLISMQEKFAFSYIVSLSLSQIKVKVTVGLQKFPHLPQYKLSGSITQLWYKLGNLY